MKKPTPFFLYIFLLFFENVKARFGLTIGCSDLFALALAQPLEQVVKVDLEVVGAHAPHGLEEGALLLGVDLGICSSLNDLGVQMYSNYSNTSHQPVVVDPHRLVDPEPLDGHQVHDALGDGQQDAVDHLGPGWTWLTG